ncbi:MAG: hypothetical protein NTZ05_07705 [Chloroflexi bacterium]|nr:hypothetical protein [Chloroflexota bacterium]
MTGTVRTRRGAKKPVEERVQELWEKGIEEVAEALLEHAKKGDMRAIIEIITRVFGKAQDKREAEDSEALTLRIIIEDGEDDTPAT